MKSALDIQRSQAETFDLAKLRLEELQRQNVELAELRSALTAAQARIEKLERMLIWCLDQGARNVRNRSLVFADLVPVEHAGTTVSVLAAVEKAMEK